MSSGGSNGDEITGERGPNPVERFEETFMVFIHSYNDFFEKNVDVIFASYWTRLILFVNSR